MQVIWFVLAILFVTIRYTYESVFKQAYSTWQFWVCAAVLLAIVAVAFALSKWLGTLLVASLIGGYFWLYPESQPVLDNRTRYELFQQVLAQGASHCMAWKARIDYPRQRLARRVQQLKVITFDAELSRWLDEIDEVEKERPYYCTDDGDFSEDLAQEYAFVVWHEGATHAVSHPKAVANQSDEEDVDTIDRLLEEVYGGGAKNRRVSSSR